jgi:hypothetical protein
VLKNKLFKIKKTSNQFFRENDLSDYLSVVDLAFIDGLHLLENVYQDFVNLETYMDPQGVIILDDIYPNTQLQGARERQTRFWMGDVWKFWLRLQELRPDLVYTELNTRPSGLGLISNLDPKSNVLAQNFNNEVRSAQSESSVIPSHVLNRSNSIAPSNRNLEKALTLSRSRRKNLACKEFWK